jgi:hypothetical protein
MAKLHLQYRLKLSNNMELIDSKLELRRQDSDGVIDWSMLGALAWVTRLGKSKPFFTLPIPDVPHSNPNLHLP